MYSPAAAKRRAGIHRCRSAELRASAPSVPWIPDKRCAWTDRRLAGSYDVDHIIPFALWHNNELWNLVPADPRANHAKRDHLPTRRLLKQRRPIIVDYWQRLAAEMPRQFQIELCHLTGGTTTDYPAGFDALVEAVETTALQRGASRWDGWDG